LKLITAFVYAKACWVFYSYAACHTNQVPFVRSSLNHEDIFILDTANKIFQFNGSNSCIQERAKALEVVQYIKDTFHEGKCEVAAVGKLFFFCLCAFALNIQSHI
jgi:hypothetical protein